MAELVLQWVRDEAVPKRRPLWAWILGQRRSRDRVELLLRALRINIRAHSTHQPQVMAPLPAVEWKGRVVLQR